MKYSKISFKNTVVAIQRWRSSEVTLRTRNIIGMEEWKLGSALAENIFWHWFKHPASNLRFKWYFYTGIQGAPSSSIRVREFIDASFFHECFPIPSSRNLCTDLRILGRRIFIQRFDLSDHIKNFEKERSTINN